MDNNHSNNNSGDFASMLDGSFNNMGRLEPGQKIKANIVNITDEWIFLDIGRKGEGVLDKKEMLDKEGKLKVSLGENIEVFFVKAAQGEMRFTTRLGRGDNGAEQLEDAYQNRIPVEGLVEKEIKGGFEIKIGGKVRAFCPYSQISLKRVEDNSVYIGEKFLFHITEFSERGRNIVVSRREILKEEEEKAKEKIKNSLNVGQIVRGRITSIQKFGAFLDIGGVEGLLPISEIAYERVNKVDDILSVGQEVEVEITALDWDRNRHSFSLKKLLEDPWNKVTHLFPVGSTHKGKVVRLKQFGAFISLGEGIDGLLHVSRLKDSSNKRVQFPAQVLKEGEMLDVVIEGIDVEQKRISLALPSSASDISAESEEDSWKNDYKPKQEKKGSMGSLGKLLQEKLLDK